MHPDEALAPGRRDGLRKLVDRDRAGVGREDGRVGGALVQGGPEGALDLEVLEDRLHDEVRRADQLHVVRGQDPPDDRVAIVQIELALGDGTLEVRQDARPAGARPLDIGLVQDHALADRGVDLADAVAHQAGAGDEDAVDVHGRRVAV